MPFVQMHVMHRARVKQRQTKQRKAVRKKEKEKEREKSEQVLWLSVGCIPSSVASVASVPFPAAPPAVLVHPVASPGPCVASVWLVCCVWLHLWPLLKRWLNPKQKQKKKENRFGGGALAVC